MSIEITLALFLGIAVVAFFCEYGDASLGMGYGTTLTPLLLIIGLAPLDVVPAVLLGQLAGGISGGYFHYRVGNITLGFSRHTELAGEKSGDYWNLSRLSQDTKVILTLALCGVIGSIVGVISAINMPTIVLKSYIGAMVLGIGIIILIRRNHQSPFSLKKLFGIGLLSAFNKGISGGGYGPLVTGGQMLSGREVKNSIGSTTVAEVLVCVIGFLAYLLLKGEIYWPLVAATSVGSLGAGPLAALTVRKMKSKRLKLIVGAVITLLGLLTLARVPITS